MFKQPIKKISKRSPSQTLKFGILNAAGTIAAQHGEIMGTRIAVQKQAARATIYKSKPAATQAALPTKAKASAKLAAPAETSIFQIEPLTSTTTSTSLTDTISSSIDRDLGYLVNPKQIATNAIATSTIVHRRVLGNNTTNTYSVNAVYGLDSNQSLISLINYQTPYGRQVQEISRMHGGVITPGCTNANTLILTNKPVSFLERVGVGVFDFIIPVSHAKEANTSSNISQLAYSEIDDIGYFNQAMIAAGRTFMKLGQGVKQLGLQVQVKRGVVSQKELDNYTRQINTETELYARTQVANSMTGKVSEIATEMLVFSVIPLGATVKGAKFSRIVYSSAASGAITAAIMPVADGRIETRLQNAAIGGVAGATITVGIYGAGKAIMPIFQAAKPVIAKTYNLAKGISNKYEIRSPILIEPPKGTMLYSFPGGVVDGIKLRNPVKKRVETKSNYHAYHAEPKILSGFPEARIAKKIGNRKRWELPDGKMLEWDRQHGEIEMYNKRGVHIGVYDPSSGTQIKKAVPGRKIDI